MIIYIHVHVYVKFVTIDTSIAGLCQQEFLLLPCVLSESFV